MGEMKTIMLPRIGYTLDPTSGDIKRIESERNGVDNIFIVPENCIVRIDDTVLDAEEGDLVITFYEARFPNKAVVIKSDMWKQNIEAYKNYIQKQKEEWAKSKNNSCICEACDCCDATIPISLN